MKRVAAMIMVLLILTTMGSTTIFAEDADITVYVTISDAEGKLALTQKEVAVTDVDQDGALTLHDALYAAHANYPGGVEEGYQAVPSEFGISLERLWGTTNGGSYGYYVNNASAMGLTDTIKDGDYLNAYVYTDLTSWSDTYCYFNVNTVSAKVGEEVALTLSAASFDANWAPIVVPVADATITVNGQATQYKTDAEGNVTVKIEEAGAVVISATSNSQTLVPPVCIANVVANAENEDNNFTGDDENTIYYLIAAGVALVLMVVLFLTRKKPNDK